MPIRASLAGLNPPIAQPQERLLETVKRDARNQQGQTDVYGKRRRPRMDIRIEEGHVPDVKAVAQCAKPDGGRGVQDSRRIDDPILDTKGDAEIEEGDRRAYQNLGQGPK
jgi:hypothetical protein